MSQILKWEEKFLKIERTIFELTKIATNLPDPNASKQMFVDRDRVDESIKGIAAF